jgi:hypothetical protein
MMDRARALWSQTVTHVRAGAEWILRETRQILDLDALRSANGWRGRLDAVSWKRAAIAGGGLAVIALAAGLWTWLAQPEFRGHPPRLPTEQEWRANQAAARAMEGELSPALEAANKSVTP